MHKRQEGACPLFHITYQIKRLTFHSIFIHWIADTGNSSKQLLSHRTLCRHVIFAPSSINTYAGSVFPDLYDALTNTLEHGGSPDEVQKQLDILGTHFRYAAQVVEDPSLQYVLETLQE